MHVDARLTARGIAVELHGELSIAVPYELQFPEEIWDSFSSKEFLLNEIAYAATLAIPLLTQSPEATYSTGQPRFLRLYNFCFEHAVPNMTEAVHDEDPLSIITRWRGIRRTFMGRTAATVDWPRHRGGRTVVIPFSFGKDSLLSLALLMRMGCDVVPVSINEFMLPRAWKMKTAREDDLARITGLEMRHVYNEIQLLSDYEVIGVPETRLYQVSAHFIHLLAMLPLCEYYSARHIVLNNELLNTLTYLHRTGIIAPQRFMQSRRATDIMRSMAAFATGGTVSVVNLIDGLGDFAIHYLLHEHFPELSKLRISCDMELTRHRLWCHNCDRCARAYLFSLALDENTEEMGFRRSMAGKKLMKHFNALNRHHRRDEYREFTGREERLACRMARAHGHRHPLISALGYDAVPDTKEDFSSMARTVFGIHERRFLRPLYRRNRKIIDSMLSKIRSCSGGGIHF